MREKGRSTIYGMAGVYLLYLAYQMYEVGWKGDASISSDILLMKVFCVLFVLFAIGLFLMAGHMLKKASGNKGKVLLHEIKPKDNQAIED